MRPGTLIQAIWPSFNIYAVAASSVFSIPFWRHFIAWLGAMEASPRNFKKVCRAARRGVACCGCACGLWAVLVGCAFVCVCVFYEWCCCVVLSGANGHPSYLTTAATDADCALAARLALPPNFPLCRCSC